MSGSVETVQRCARWTERRTERTAVLVGLALVGAVFSTARPVALPAVADPDDPGAGVAFTVTDPAIVESSGLAWADVDGRRWIVTVNDSGDTGQVFTLDPETGETVGVTTFAPDPRDVEAVAPAGDGHVWVADIGDNARARDTVTLTRVAVGPGERTAHEPRRRELRYPDRARDAETLLRHPETGRLFVVTKSVLAGRVWQVPEGDDDAVATLREVATVPALVTDGAFLPSGDAVLLRGYTHGFLLTYPEWDLVETFALPPQPQGEGLTVLPDGDVLLSTEGRDRDVLRIALPRGVRPERDPVRTWWQGVWSRWVALL